SLLRATLLCGPDEKRLKGRFFPRALKRGELRHPGDAAGECFHGMYFPEPLAEGDAELQVALGPSKNIGDPLLDGVRTELESHLFEPGKLFRDPPLLVAQNE